MADLFSFYNKKKLPCRVCGHDFPNSDDIVNFHQRRLHKNCYKCRMCSFSFVENPEAHPKELHEFPYCQECYSEETGEPLCRACHETIGDNEKYVNPTNMPKRKFHSRCFLCGNCKSPLKDAYSIKQGQPHCLTCYNPEVELQQSLQSK